MSARPDPRGPSPKGFFWCADRAQRCRCRVMKRGGLCEHHRPRRDHGGPSGGTSPEARRREQRRKISAGLAWEGI